MTVPIPEEAIEAAREAAVRTGSTKASIEAAAPLILAAAFSQFADELKERADLRVADSLAAGDRECDGDCDTSDCHAVSAVGTYSVIAARLRIRASVLRGEGQTQ